MVMPAFAPGPPSRYEPAPATGSHVRTTVPSAVCRALKFAGSFAVAAVTGAGVGSATMPPPVTIPGSALTDAPGATTRGCVGGTEPPGATTGVGGRPATGTS